MNTAMHSVQRSVEPNFLTLFRARYSGWEDLSSEERRRVRAELSRDFDRICGYCERQCNPDTPGRWPDGESVDHFLPRSRFPVEWLNWLNLVYSCHRCNLAKGNKWPAIGDAENTRLGVINRYRQVAGYVCPNSADFQLPAETFFTFDVDNGEIRPADDLDDEEWSMAYRTIIDLDLNSLDSRDDLPNQRKVERQLLDETLRQASEADLRHVIVSGITQRSRPFSSYMSAYAKAIGFDV